MGGGGRTLTHRWRGAQSRGGCLATRPCGSHARLDGWPRAVASGCGLGLYGAVEKKADAYQTDGATAPLPSPLLPLPSPLLPLLPLPLVYDVLGRKGAGPGEAWLVRSRLAGSEGGQRDELVASGAWRRMAQAWTAAECECSRLLENLSGVRLVPLGA